MKRILLACSVLALLMAANGRVNPQCRAIFASGDEAPVDRLAANIAEYLKDKVGDPKGHYLLGRVHALAYAYKTDKLSAFGFSEQKEGDLPRLDDHYHHRGKDEPEIDAALRRRYLVIAVNSYREAIRLAPNTPLCHLGLASVLEMARGELADVELAPVFADTLKKPDSAAIDAKIAEIVQKSTYSNFEHLFSDIIKEGAHGVPVLRKLMQNPKFSADCRKALERIWINEAIQHYWLAYMLSIKKDIPERENYELSTPISQEAGEHYLKLVYQRGPTEFEEQRIPQIRRDISTLKRRGIAMTPIIFSETHVQPLDALLSPAIVRFDMNGDGIEDEIPWVKPDTAILVWDPQQRGNITSGRQLFGSVTWWIFWRDGYEALSALDDNHDGELRGTELRGLAIWRDANSNGVSEAGEVMPVESTQIASLFTTSTTVVSPGNSPANPFGLKLKDGRALPTYDWTFTIPAGN
ncbi:MAG TPA: hypothetical protein VEK08_06170 [Planctomycetota bacterium]|nr:hypothetical protein [Planctomycetota bacterium]